MPVACQLPVKRQVGPALWFSWRQARAIEIMAETAWSRLLIRAAVALRGLMRFSLLGQLRVVGEDGAELRIT
jgi:hypothetical protein